jgi:hypothetical protein
MRGFSSLRNPQAIVIGYVTYISLGKQLLFQEVNRQNSPVRNEKNTNPMGDVNKRKSLALVWLSQE